MEALGKFFTVLFFTVLFPLAGILGSILLAPLTPLMWIIDKLKFW